MMNVGLTIGALALINNYGGQAADVINGRTGNNNSSWIPFK